MASKRNKGNSVGKKVGEGDKNVKMENIPGATVGDKPDKGNQNEKDNLVDEDAGHTKIPSNSLLTGRAAKHERSSRLLEIPKHANKASEEGSSGTPEITNHPNRTSDEGRSGPPEIPNHPNKASEEGSSRPLEIPKHANKASDEGRSGLPEIPKEPASPMRLAGILLVVAFLLVILAILIAPEKPERKPFVLPIIFENKIKELQSSFTNQTDRFWRILKNRGLAHLNNPSPSQPLVLLLAAPPAAHSTVDCFAKKLAEGLDPEYKRMLATIDGREERSYPGEDTKKKMDDLLKRKFMDGHRAALVHHLELLPPPSPLLFYSYCDDQNAPHKHVAIIFTVHLSVEPDASLEPKEAEGTVEKYLADIVWAKEDKDAVAALLSRVADTVALMNGEPSSSATC